MFPIVNRPLGTVDGAIRYTLTLEPFCFMLNTIAMGDAIAAVPVVKYMVENHYTESDSYYVVAKKHYHCLFPFVPLENLRDFDVKDNFWNMPTSTIMALLNKKNEPGVTRNTPKHMHLGQFASILLADRILPEKHLQYVPLEQVDIEHFGIDFTNTVVLVTSYRDVTRMWQADYILEVAGWLKSRGITPVFIGKTDMDQTAREAVIPKSSLPADISYYGIDLRNKTTIPELASIFRKTRAVVGLDSGPIHLAGTTDVPIVCGYTSVSPEHRIPIRQYGQTYPVLPDIDCLGCESRWRSILWNYENCYLHHAKCCAEMTPDRFIKALKAIV